MEKQTIFGPRYFFITGTLSLIALFLPEFITLGFYLFIIPGFLLGMAPTLFIYPLLVQTLAQFFLGRGYTSGRAWLYGFLTISGLSVLGALALNVPLYEEVKSLSRADVQLPAPVTAPASIAVLENTLSKKNSNTSCTQTCTRLLTQTPAHFILFGQHQDLNAAEAELRGFEKCAVTEEEYCANPIRRALSDAQYVIVKGRKVRTPEKTKRKWRLPVQTIEATSNEVYKNENGRFVLIDRETSIKAHPFVVPFVIGPRSTSGIETLARPFEKTLLVNRTLYPTAETEQTLFYDRIFGTPHISATRYDVRVIRERLRHGGPNSDSGLSEIAAMLARGGHPDFKDEYGYTLLEYALQERKAKAVELLLAHGAGLGKNRYDHRLLSMALFKCDKRNLLVLLKSGIKLDTEDTVNSLTAACPERDSEARIDILNTLLQHGADINKIGRDNYSVLMQAASNGDLAVVRFLISKGADVNIANTYGQTALMYAVKDHNNEKDRASIVSLLLEHGADIHARNKEGQGLEDLARNSSPPVAALIYAALKNSLSSR